MEIRAVQKFVRMSPRKLRLVVPLVKNLSPTDAVEVLPHTGKRAAELLGKVIKSAIASAKDRKISDGDLIFKEIQITDGPRLKRYRAGARGRVKPYQRKMSHIRVLLETKEPEEIKKSRGKITTGAKYDERQKKTITKKTIASGLGSSVRKRIARSKSKKAVVRRRSTRSK